MGKSGGKVRRRIKSRDAQVCGHDGLNACIDRSLERKKLHPIQTIPIAIDGRQHAVRIQICVPMTRKMFGCCDQAKILTTLDKGFGNTTDQFRVLADRPCVDDRIIRIDVDIHHRRRSHMNTEGPSLFGCDFSHRVCQVLRIGRTQ